MNEEGLGRCDQLMREQAVGIPSDQALALEVPGLVAEVRRLNIQVDVLRKALDKDATGLCKALGEIMKEVKARRWVVEGRGDYTFNDDRYRKETGWAFDAILRIAEDALHASCRLAHEALAQKRNDEVKPPTAWKEHWLRAAQFLKSYDAGSDTFSEGWHEAANKIEERAGMVEREPYTS